ncbi:MAG: NADH-quinone oxidoreductase subunit N [Halieaceae bacterium]
MSSGLDLNSFQGLAPILVLSIGAVLLMLQLSVHRNTAVSYVITLLSFLLAAASTRFAAEVAPLQITPLLRADEFALFFSLLFCLGGAVTAVISYEYLARRRGQNEEFFLLLILSSIGAITLVYATHLAALLLGLELLGVALYALIAYPDEGALPLEAAIKYLVLSGAASSIFLFGFALLYAALGTLTYTDMRTATAALQPQSFILIYAGAAMVFTGLGFKLSAVPFHMWTPDVYEGAPAPVSGFLAAISKAAVFAAILRWWLEAGFYEYERLLLAVGVVAAASMLVGNLLALQQSNVKRIMAYSSIAHIGYLLIVLVAIGISPDRGLAVEAAAYYLVAYAATTLAAFTLLGLLSSADGQLERDQLEDVSGLFWQQPALALLFSVALLSLAGIPLTAGFIGKFYLFTVGVDAALWTLLGLLVLGSAISIYYYLRIIFTMTQRTEPVAGSSLQISLPGKLVFYALIGTMLYLGVMPDALMTYLGTIL